MWSLEVFMGLVLNGGYSTLKRLAQRIRPTLLVIRPDVRPDHGILPRAFASARDALQGIAPAPSLSQTVR
jgi:hypothetical protein